MTKTTPYLDRQVRLITEGVRRAFVVLRQQNFIARMNFLCCQGCAGYSITGLAVKRHEAGKVVNGMVYYHNQDRDSLFSDGYLYLAFGDVTHSYYEDGKPVMENGKHKELVMGLPTVEVGQKVVEAIKATGLSVEWDGTDGTRIKVFATPETQLTGVKVIPEAIDISYPNGSLRNRHLPTTKLVDGKPVCKLLGTNGNVFALAGKVTSALKNAGQADKAKEFSDRIMDTGSYDEALQLMMKYVEVQ